jgi:hypothetical protein
MEMDGDADEKVWMRMKKWICDVGIRTFPWHLPWKTTTYEGECRIWATNEARIPVGMERRYSLMSKSLYLLI